MPEPRICLYDIETAPSLGLYFDRYREGNIIAEVRPWFMMSFSYKWQGEKKIHYHCLADYPAFDRDIHDDKALVVDLHRLVYSKADCLVAHNGDRFDQRKTKARFLKHGLPPPPPIKSIDTLKIARRVFKMDSNRLNDIGEYLGLGGKYVTKGDLWKRCYNGDREAYKEMGRYNKRDVDLLEKVFDRLAPWQPNPPILMTGDGCPNCGGFKSQRRGYNIARKSKSPRLQCQDCGQWYSGQREAA
jgi:DNA polymerase elongation subunit (family B)